MSLSTRDTFAQPRCAETAIHGATEGAWEYRIIPVGTDVPPGWRVLWICRERVLIKFTHEERVYP
jgi:hypothetical protein